MSKGELGLSGLVCARYAGGGGLPADPREDADVRIFKPGGVCTFPTASSAR